MKLEGEEKVDDSDDELSILGDSIVRNIQINKPNLCLPANVPGVASGIKKKLSYVTPGSHKIFLEGRVSFIWCTVLFCLI